MRTEHLPKRTTSQHKQLLRTTFDRFVLIRPTIRSLNFYSTLHTSNNLRNIVADAYGAPLPMTTNAHTAQQYLHQTASQTTSTLQQYVIEVVLGRCGGSITGLETVFRGVSKFYKHPLVCRLTPEAFLSSFRCVDEFESWLTESQTEPQINASRQTASLLREKVYLPLARAKAAKRKCAKWA